MVTTENQIKFQTTHLQSGAFHVLKKYLRACLNIINDIRVL